MARKLRPGDGAHLPDAAEEPTLRTRDYYRLDSTPNPQIQRTRRVKAFDSAVVNFAHSQGSPGSSQWWRFCGSTDSTPRLPGLNMIVAQASMSPIPGASKAPPCGGGVVARQASVPASHGCPALLILSTDVPPPTAADNCHSSIPLTGVVLKQNSLDRENEDVPLFALGLINSAVELGGAAFLRHPRLLNLIQDELFRNLMQFGLSMSPMILAMVSSIVLNLYHHLRTELKLQLEAFFSCVVLRLAQSRYGASYQQQEVAMEALVDFCRQKTFMVEMYANLDCEW